MLKNIESGDAWRVGSGSGEKRGVIIAPSQVGYVCLFLRLRMFIFWDHDKE